MPPACAAAWIMALMLVGGLLVAPCGAAAPRPAAARSRRTLLGADGWAVAPACKSAVTAKSASDSSGRRWGYEGGASCAFKDEQQQPLLPGAPAPPLQAWSSATACGDAPSAANSAPDSQGRLWGVWWSRSCAFKGIFGQPLYYVGYAPRAPAAATSPSPSPRPASPAASPSAPRPAATPSPAPAGKAPTPANQTACPCCEQGLLLNASQIADAVAENLWQRFADSTNLYESTSVKASEAPGAAATQQAVLGAFLSSILAPVAAHNTTASNPPAAGALGATAAEAPSASVGGSSLDPVRPSDNPHVMDSLGANSTRRLLTVAYVDAAPRRSLAAEEQQQQQQASGAGELGEAYYYDEPSSPHGSPEGGDNSTAAPASSGSDNNGPASDSNAAAPAATSNGAGGLQPAGNGTAAAAPANASWTAAPACGYEPNATNSVKDASGRLWGWGARANASCAFKAPGGNMPLFTWETAPPCSSAASATQAVKDSAGRAWGWQDGASCRF